jgi:hypothetical protein
MSDIINGGPGGEGKHGQARALVEAALRARRAGQTDRSALLLDEAQRVDPQSVEDLLMELAPGDQVPGRATRFDPARADAEVAAMSRTIEPKSDSPSRSGITGNGSGADSQ